MFKNRKYIMAFSASICLTSPVLFSGPLELYVREHNPPLLDFVNSILAFMLIFLCVSLLLGWIMTKLLPSGPFEIVAGLVLGLSLFLGFVSGYAYRLLSGEWHPLPYLLGVFGGIVVVGVGLVNALKTPMNRLTPLK